MGIGVGDIDYAGPDDISEDINRGDGVDRAVVGDGATGVGY